MPKVNIMRISRKRRRQWVGFGIGVFLTTVAYVLLSVPSGEAFLTKGPMNTGHEELSCKSCHSPARGNTFQQIQANVLYAFGLRKTEADFGSENVDNQKCLDCHDTRDNDRHPLHRFTETRFAEARKNLGVTYCESCHMEHNGVRVTQVNIGYCVNCHGETEMTDDPLDIPHKELIAKKMWTTCLQCHDFHGNHIYEAAISIKDTIPLVVVRDYFNGGATPYADKKKYYPLTEDEYWVDKEIGEK